MLTIDNILYLQAILVPLCVNKSFFVNRKICAITCIVL